MPVTPMQISRKPIADTTMGVQPNRRGLASRRRQAVAIPALPHRPDDVVTVATGQMTAAMVWEPARTVRPDEGQSAVRVTVPVGVRRIDHSSDDRLLSVGSTNSVCALRRRWVGTV